MNVPHFRPGMRFEDLSAAEFNYAFDIIRRLEHLSVGPGLTLNKAADGYKINRVDKLPTRPRTPSSAIEVMKLKSIRGDYLVCERDDGAVVNVAKQPGLRQSLFDKAIPDNAQGLKNSEGQLCIYTYDQRDPVLGSLVSTRRSVLNDKTKQTGIEVVRQVWRVGWPVNVATTVNPTGAKFQPPPLPGNPPIPQPEEDIFLLDVGDADRGWVHLDK